MQSSESNSSLLVIFDLDGTLVETGPDLVASLNHSIATIGLAPFSESDVGHLVGQGARTMILRALKERGFETDDETVQRLFASFLAHYEETMPGQSVPYPGVVAALDSLAGAGMRLAVCTNKSEALARLLLEKLGMARHFAAVAGGDTFAVRKPDPGHIRGTIDLAQGSSDTSVMIGDSENDILAAQRAGIASIAVSFGYSDRPAADLGATMVIDGYQALTPSLITTLVDR